MITKLDIKKFKDLDLLSIKDLNQVTLISGKNNIGKTSLLEAIFLLFNYKYSSLLVPILGNRFASNLPFNIVYNIPFDFAINGIFSNYDHTSDILISSDNDEVVLKVINTDQSFIQPNSNIRPNSIGGNSVIVKTDSLNIQYKQNGKEYFTAAASKNITQNAMYAPQFKNVDVLPKILTRTILINEFGELFKIDDSLFSPREQWVILEYNNIRTNYRDLLNKYLIPGLRLLNPKINNVELGVDPLNSQLQRIELILDGESRPLPLSSLGHGSKRLFNIIIGIITARDGILLIDEIENGIHYSIIKKMWELIFKLAKENNCQVIATTHSLEFAGYVVNLTPEEQDLFSFVNIERANGQLLCATYDSKQFKYSINNNVEIR